MRGSTVCTQTLLREWVKQPLQSQSSAKPALNSILNHLCSTLCNGTCHKAALQRLKVMVAPENVQGDEGRNQGGDKGSNNINFWSCYLLKLSQGSKFYCLNQDIEGLCVYLNPLFFFFFCITSVFVNRSVGWIIFRSIFRSFSAGSCRSHLLCSSQEVSEISCMVRQNICHWV